MTGPSDNARTAAREPCGPKSPRDGAEDRQSSGDRPKAVSSELTGNSSVTDGRAAEKQNPSLGHHRRRGKLPAYGALDLGTNNCRLLVARPSRRGFVVIDAFSRIIRLGEG
ncbi:MAG: hypothetical protein ACR2OX_03240, partial [Methyloligellaceae bacterium]